VLLQADWKRHSERINEALVVYKAGDLRRINREKREQVCKKCRKIPHENRETARAAKSSDFALWIEARSLQSLPS
jgi:hypothetical protein